MRPRWEPWGLLFLVAVVVVAVPSTHARPEPVRRLGARGLLEASATPAAQLAALGEPGSPVEQDPHGEDALQLMYHVANDAGGDLLPGGWTCAGEPAVHPRTAATRAAPAGTVWDLSFAVDCDGRRSTRLALRALVTVPPPAVTMLQVGGAVASLAGEEGTLDDVDVDGCRAANLTRGGDAALDACLVAARAAAGPQLAEQRDACSGAAAGAAAGGLLL